MNILILLEIGIGAFLLFLIINWIKEAKEKRKEVKKLGRDIQVLNAKKEEIEETD